MFINRFFMTDPQPEDKQTEDKQLRKLIPNLITIASMVCGLTAIQMAIAAQWQNAVFLILVATILDTLDGAIARLLNATSKFGAELDSLADFLSFGVAPATIMYLWILHDAGKIGWIAALVFAIASALRLARFNAQSETQSEKPEWAKNFFTGVPAPAGSGLLLLPMIIHMELNMDLSELSFANPIIGIWTLLIAGLMVSQIPTFSSKQIRLSSFGLIPTLSILVLMIALLIHAPWITLSILAIIYASLIPIAMRVYKSREKRALKNA